jgi:hypothetical protein
VAYFFLNFPRKLCMHSSSPAWVLYAPPISHTLTWLVQLYLAKSTSYEAPLQPTVISFLFGPSILMSTLFGDYKSRYLSAIIFPNEKGHRHSSA